MRKMAGAPGSLGAKWRLKVASLTAAAAVSKRKS
jgi:hypothetical protein